MKDYLNTYLQHANLQEVASMLMDNLGPASPPQNYEQAIDTAWDALSAQLDQQIPDHKLRDDMRTLILTYANTIEDAYINLGLKAGARLLQELLHTS